MKILKPSYVLVEASIEKSPLVVEMKKNLPESRFILFEKNLLSSLELRRYPPYKTILVDSFKGRFLRSCPATKFYHCCGYTILHFGERCNIGCTYCILQAYWNQPYIKVFGNTDEMFGEVDKCLINNQDILFRIGTGEFTDSLLLDPYTGFSELLVDFFSSKPNAVLELKTKTSFIDRLAGLEHKGHTIVAWSLNAPSVVSREEPRSASLESRLESAMRCAKWGYYLAFHFDPLFFFPDWRREYQYTIERLFKVVPPERIVYISLGAFRFMPELKKVILKKKPQWKFISGEFVDSPDNKKRYFADIRVELYKFMVEEISTYAPEVCIYFCMESSSVWENVFGFKPSDRGGLSKILDQAVKNTMGVGRNCLKSASSLFLTKPQPFERVED